MKKYMAYLMSLLMLAGITIGSLQAAAAPNTRERDIKEQAVAAADLEQYRDLVKQVLHEQYKLRQCKINRRSAQEIASAQESVWDTLTEDDKNDRALNIRALETQFERITQSIATLNSKVAELKQRVAQENKGAWRRWFTRRKKVNQDIRVADIDKLERQRDSLKRKYDRCDEFRKKALSKIETYNKLFAEKRAEKQSRPQQLVQFRQLLQILTNLISKIAQKNNIMLEKDKLEWQLRLLAFERGRAALLEEERIQQLSRPPAAALEEQEEFVGAMPEPAVAEPEAQERYMGPAADFGGPEEKVFVSLEEEKGLQEKQRLQAQRSLQVDSEPQEQQRSRVAARQIQVPEEPSEVWPSGRLPQDFYSRANIESKELEADRKQIADAYTAVSKQVADLESSVFELESQLLLCQISIVCEQKKLQAQRFFFKEAYGQGEQEKSVGDWKKENSDPVKNSIKTLRSEIVKLKKNIAQENQNKGWGLLRTIRRGVLPHASVAGIGRLEKKRRELLEKKESLPKKYQECSKQLAQIQIMAGQYQQRFDEQARVHPNPHKRWVLQQFTEIISDLDLLKALTLEKDKLEREWEEASKATY